MIKLKEIELINQQAEEELKLENFHMVSKIGKGAFGKVYLVQSF